MIHVETVAAVVVGYVAGVVVRRLLELRRPRPRPQLYRVDLAELLDQAKLEGLGPVLTRILEGERMKVNVAVGGKMSLEAWRTVTFKLLDLVGGALNERERQAVDRFVDKCSRAWADLEQRAAAENPDARPPAAPVD